MYLDLEGGELQDFIVNYIRFLIHLFRRCPGSDLVDSTLWILIVTMIATLNVSMPKDQNGVTTEPQLDYDNFFFR